MLRGIGDALQPHAAVVAGVEVVGAVAGGEDVRVLGPTVVVDDDAVLDGQPGVLRQLDVREDADTDDDEVGREELAAGESDAADTVVAFERLDADAEPEVDPLLSVDAVVERGDLGGGDALEDAFCDLDDRDLDAQLPQRRRGFETDVAGADDHRSLGRPEAVADGPDVGGVAQVVNACEVHPGDVQRSRSRAQAEDELVVAHGVAVVQRDGLGFSADSGDPGLAEGHLLLLVERRLADVEVLDRRRPREERLRQRRPLVGQRRLVADQQDLAVPSVPAQADAQLCAGVAGADDDHPIRLHACLRSPSSPEVSRPSWGSAAPSSSRSP
ncbi:unannotated protein [freshwater metagenome]|uniref:Unannotated protein n=1 Tax=freshwater metagenome TaxID=449393 RepID=A0A6J7GVU7_9ZZZZ